MPIDNKTLERLQANDRTLTELNLSEQQLTASDMQALIKALQGNTSLKSLNIDNNQIGDEGAKALAQNQTLTSLDVSYNEIGAEGAKALAQNQTLTSLDVGYNQIGDEGVIALAQNQTLTTLYMYGNEIGAEGAKALAQNQTLTSLAVRYNRIGAEGAKALAQNQTLTSLSVGDNQIGDEGAKALTKNQIQTVLGIRGNQIGYEISHQIPQMLAANKQRRQQRCNQFILTLGKVFSRANALASTELALPAELIDLIGSYLDVGFFLQLASINHPSHLGKTEEQVYQAMLFLLYQFTEGDWVEASIKEHKPPVNQALDHRRHFTLFNPVRSPQATEEERNNPTPCVLQ